MPQVSTDLFLNPLLGQAKCFGGKGYRPMDRKVFLHPFYDVMMTKCLREAWTVIGQCMGKFSPLMISHGKSYLMEERKKFEEDWEERKKH